MRTFLATLLVAATVAASSPCFADEVDTLFQEGTAAAKAGDYPTAYDKIIAVWKQRPSFDVAANLAFVEQRLGKKRDAAEHLEYALATFPATGDQALKDRMQTDLAALRAELGRVQVDAPEGCTLSVDGEERGRTPLEASFIYVQPGKRVFEGTRPGERGMTEVEVKPGQTLAIKIVLEPEKTGTTPKAEPSPVPLWPGLVVGGLGIGGLGAGIGLAVAAGSARSNAETAKEGLGSPNACRSSTPDSACAGIQEDLETRDLFSNASMGVFIASGVLIAGGATLLGIHFAGGSSASDETAVFVPWIGPGIAGGAFGGSF
jgi:hypothetical protein